MNLPQARQIVFLCAIYENGHLNKGLLGEARATLERYGHDYKLIEEIADENKRALSELRGNRDGKVPVPEVQGDGGQDEQPAPLPQMHGKRVRGRAVRRV